MPAPAPPPLVRELTRLRFERLEKDQELSALREAVAVASRRVGKSSSAAAAGLSYRRGGVGLELAIPSHDSGDGDDIDNDNDNDDNVSTPAVALSPESARAALKLKATENRYRATAMELTMVELEVELCHWKDWLGSKAHYAEGCEYCTDPSNDFGVGYGGERLRLSRMPVSVRRSGGKSPRPLTWKKAGGLRERRARRDARRILGLSTEVVRLEARDER